MKLNKTFLLLSFSFFLSHTSLFSGNIINTDTIKDVSVVKYFSDDLVAARLDELATSVLFAGKNFYGDTAALNIYKFKPNDVPQYTDEQYKAYFKKMSVNSPFPFVYNEDVRKFIDLYSQKRRPLTSRLLGLAAYYFPLFEEKLDKYNLPLELKYLAVIESALNPVATSRAGASGLWQFMYGTGKMYGLEVSSYVDDRCDPYKATTAACEHFIDLYRIYKDWALVLAAYNAGSGNVNKAIRRAGGEMDYWKVRKFMPRETQSYVPVFIAAAFVMSHASEYNLYPVYPEYLYIKTDTVTVSEKISFEQISEALNIPMAELMSLNPCFKKNVIPASTENPYQLKLPYERIGEFIANEKEIYNFKTLDQLIKEDYAARNNIKPVYAESHIVKKGESLGQIARKYSCTIGDIQKWNKIKNTNIHPGQKLIVSNSSPANQIVLPKPPVNTTNETYTVGPNETLRDIAKKFDCTVDNLRLWNNISNLNLTKGQLLTIHIPIIEPVKDVNMLETTVKNEPVKESAPVVKADVHKALSEQLTVAPADTHTTSPDTTLIVDEPKTKDINKEPAQKYIFHVVQKGDTLWNIAQRYHSVTVEDIKRINSLKGSNLKLGQKLKLPVKDKG